MHWNRRVPEALVLMVLGMPGKRPSRATTPPRPSSLQTAGIWSPKPTRWLMSGMHPPWKPAAVTSVNVWISPPRPNSAATDAPRFTFTSSFVNLHAGCDSFCGRIAASSGNVTTPPELSVRLQSPGGNVAGSHASRDWMTTPSPLEAPAVAASARLAVATASTLKTARRRKPFDIARSPFPYPCARPAAAMVRRRSSAAQAIHGVPAPPHVRAVPGVWRTARRPCETPRRSGTSSLARGRPHPRAARRRRRAPRARPTPHAPAPDDLGGAGRRARRAPERARRLRARPRGGPQRDAVDGVPHARRARRGGAFAAPGPPRGPPPPPPPP